MPELPEVETVKSGLEQNVIGKKISNVNISNKNLRFPFPDNFISNLTNNKITLVTRRARYLLIHLDSKQILLVHLGMSGKLNYFSTFPKSTKKHDHVFINFDDNSGLIYNDTRRFGFVDLVDEGKINSHKMIKDLGPEPLMEDFNSNYLAKILKNKSMNIKTTMMDNKIVVGVGNIYINESLFLSGISPLKPSNKLSLSQIDLLIKNIKGILQKAIKAGGSTLRDYVDLKGDVGEFQFDFKVYARDNENCFDCSSFIKRVKQNGRSSFYCPKCQK